VPEFGAVYRVTLTPADIGFRVTVRRAVEGGVGDVVGELVGWAGGVLTIRTRRGDVAVPESSLLAARRVGGP
jgi:hypothetical protein